MATLYGFLQFVVFCTYSSPLLVCSLFMLRVFFSVLELLVLSCLDSLDHGDSLPDGENDLFDSLVVLDILVKLMELN